MTLKGSMLAYCASSLGLTMIHHTFYFYYVKVFLNRYHIQEWWFHTAQILFLVWNAINDPLFAVLQDNAKFRITRTRRESILYTAPFLAASFMLPWFSLATADWAVGLHLILALCLYDTMFTFVGLALCCLFTEISTDQRDRLLLTRYSQLAGMLGHSAILVTEYTSSSLQDFRAFQVTVLCVALTGMCLMLYTGLHAHTVWDLQQAHDKRPEKGQGGGGPLEDGEHEPCWLKTWQILSEKNFIIFVVTNFFQEFHKTYLSNFTAIVCDYLVPASQVSLGVRSVFYTSTGILGGVMVIFGAPIVGHYGYFRVIHCSFLLKILSGLAMLAAGRSSPCWVLMLFMLLDTSCTGAAYSLFNMPLSDICDQDREKHNRKHPISSTVYGANALVVKPANSLSPMLVVAVLNHFGYENLKDGMLSPQETELVKDVMFYIVCLYPVVLGALQCITWSQFSIRHSLVVRHDYTLTVHPQSPVLPGPL